MPRRITLVSTESGPGHNCRLAQALKKYGRVTTVWEFKSPYKLDYIVPDAVYGYDKIPRMGDDLIIVGCLCFDRLRQKRRSWYRLLQNYGNIHVIVTDGRFARDPDRYNLLFRNIDILTTGCKRHFRRGLPTKTYYQPFDLSWVKIKKTDTLSVGHSAFVKKKYREKGSPRIINEVSRYDVEFDLITGVSWRDSILRKSRLNIYIDQIDHYDRDKFKFTDPDYIWPALGKSGLEAMHLGCAVITYGKAYNTEIPAPPVAWITEDTFSSTLGSIIENPKLMNNLAQECQAWAFKYSNPDFQARNVLKL